MANDEQSTPDDLFDKLNTVFKFDLDAAASKKNAKCKNYITKEDDALSIDWAASSIWCNPPYSIKAGPILKWLQKGNIEARKNCLAVFLIPADVSTKHFKYSVINATEIVFLTPRICFGSNEQGAKFSSMLAIFKRGKCTTCKMSLWDWKNEEYNKRIKL